MTIEPYATAHLTSAAQCYIDAFAGEPWFETWEISWAENRLKWISEVPDFYGLVALDDTNVIGGLFGYAKPYRERKDYELLELFVAPDHQRRGIGQALMQRLHNDARRLNFNAIHLLTASNSVADDFYRTTGYHRHPKLQSMNRKFSTTE